MTDRKLDAPGFWVRPSPGKVAIGRAYFGMQAVAGAAWWILVFMSTEVRHATLGAIDPVLMGVADVPLFVVMSALAACGVRWAVMIATTWTALVAVGMLGYASVTMHAGWGALLMAAAGIGSAISLLLVRYARIPADRLLFGKLGSHTADTAEPLQHLRRTLLQLAGFWVFFLAVLPAALLVAELRWGVHFGVPPGLRLMGGVLFVPASLLGLWSAFTMALNGKGTPLPSAAANVLVVKGPYRFVRNPMAVAGVAQMIAVGTWTGSWLVIVCALCGTAYWNELVRPFEEADLVERFGESYHRYRLNVRCWWPRVRPYTV